MPRASLENLLKDASKHNAVLVMRGLKDDSFKKTAEFLQTFKDSQQGEVIEINPELFDIYQIKKAPVFILVKNNKQINRLSGNVTLEFAARKLRESL